MAIRFVNSIRFHGFKYLKDRFGKSWKALIPLIVFLTSCSEQGFPIATEKMGKGLPQGVPLNETLYMYIRNNPTLCADGIAPAVIWKDLEYIDDINNRRAEYLLQLSFCNALHGNPELSALYSYRVIALTELVSTDKRARNIAVQYLSESKEGSIVDFGWANSIILNEEVIGYSANKEMSSERYKIRGKVGLLRFQEEWDRKGRVQ